MGNVELENNIDVEVLRKQLEEAGIDLSRWGTGQARTLTSLQEEIAAGETILTTTPTGELLRKVVVACADIHYQSPDGQRFCLKEEKQIFKDGRERHREGDHPVSEKMKPGENPEDAIIRGMQEELDIEGKITLAEDGIDVQTTMSRGYPGLITRYVRHKFQVALSDSQFRLGGYIERQPEKTICFVWEKVV